MPKLDTIYEDNDLIVVNKPAGLVVNRAKTVGDLTLQDWVEKRFPQIFNSRVFASPSDFLNRSGIVHRLDRETSGILLIAKNEKAFGGLQAQFKNRQVEKVYLALCHGRLARDGVISAPLGRLPKNFGKFAVKLDGREAQTRFYTLKYLRLPDELIEQLIQGLQVKNLDYYKQFAFFSYVRLLPKTGRTHQIRVHLKSLNKPIVADKIYLNKRLYQFDMRWCPRLFLHATGITFTHPLSGKKLSFHLDLPNDLQKALNRLEEVN